MFAVQVAGIVKICECHLFHSVYIRFLCVTQASALVGRGTRLRMGLMNNGKGNLASEYNGDHRMQTYCCR